MANLSRTPIEIGLNAAIVAVRDESPLTLVIRPRDAAAEDALPFGPFDPLAHRTLEIGLRNWVQELTAFDLGYVEQLYTFGDRGRHARPGDTGLHEVSVGYLALTRIGGRSATPRGAVWRDWYDFFPWEDWRAGKPELVGRVIEPLLRDWAARPEEQAFRSHIMARPERARLCFGLDGLAWDEEKVLERYELLYEAGLVAEAVRDERPGARPTQVQGLAPLGRPMALDHRRILATAMGRLRGKIKYRPVIFELMPPDFTLTELQRTVEAISGAHLHKQNFRRLVEKGGLVEPTGDVRAETGGRPAKLFRFRREVMRERPAPGLRMKAGRG